jgi:hypothetical protein
MKIGLCYWNTQYSMFSDYTKYSIKHDIIHVFRTEKNVLFRYSSCSSCCPISNWTTIADSLTCCSTGCWCKRSHSNPCWARCSDRETSRHCRTIGCDNQSICASRHQSDVDSKLVATTSTVIIRCNQVLRWIGWINRIIVKTAISVDCTTTCESVCASRENHYSDCLIIVITCCSTRAGKYWTAIWQGARNSA